MIINRFNYEEYFLLYVDNELSPVERNAVEVFVQDNPDLRQELFLFQQTLLRADKRRQFDDKASLLKSTASSNPVNESNYEEYFILYWDNELSNEEKDQVEQFIYKNPQHQVSFEMFEKVRFNADNTIAFPDKKSLYRSEENEKVVVLRWWRIAVAAVVLLFIGAAGWYFSATTNDPKTGITKKEVIPSIDTSANTPVLKNNYVQNNSEENKATNEVAVPVKKIIRESINNFQSLGKERTILLTKNIFREKIISESLSNIRKEPIVIPSELAIVEVSEKKVSEPGNNKGNVVDEEVSFEKLSTNDPNPTASFASNTNDKIEVLNTSFSNKNKMRGFFRKVSRVVDKATSFGNNESSENKKGLRIANFEIALK